MKLEEVVDETVGPLLIIRADDITLGLKTLIEGAAFTEFSRVWGDSICVGDDITPIDVSIFFD